MWVKRGAGLLILHQRAKAQYELNFYLHIPVVSEWPWCRPSVLYGPRAELDERYERKGEGRQWTWPTWVPLSEVSDGTRISPWPAWELSFGSGVKWFPWKQSLWPDYSMASTFPRNSELHQAWDPEFTVRGTEGQTDSPFGWQPWCPLPKVCLPPPPPSMSSGSSRTLICHPKGWYLAQTERGCWECQSHSHWLRWPESRSSRLASGCPCWRCRKLPPWGCPWWGCPRAPHLQEHREEALWGGGASDPPTSSGFSCISLRAGPIWSVAQHCDWAWLLGSLVDVLEIDTFWEGVSLELFFKIKHLKACKKILCNKFSNNQSNTAWAP